jgi:hypothetical protein
LFEQLGRQPTRDDAPDIQDYMCVVSALKQNNGYATIIQDDGVIAIAISD